MDPRRGCPAQIPDRGQYVHSSRCSEVEEVGSSDKGPRGRAEHTDKTGMGRAEGEENLMSGGWPMKKERELIKLARSFSLPFPESKRGRISATPVAGQNLIEMKSKPPARPD
jgi:hypothetical protein